MSISRKNWSALSSLARQWTMEDEEEVEREKRRKVKSSTSGVDGDLPCSDVPTSDSPFQPSTTTETSQELSNVEQIQVDFVEMLRVRDEKRRKRHVEALRRQKEVEDVEAGGEGQVRVEILGDASEEQDSTFFPITSKTQPLPSSASNGPGSRRTSAGSNNRQNENGESLEKRPDPLPATTPTRKFVSSVSISLDKTPSTSGSTTPMSPCSPTTPWSPRESGPSPCQSPSPRAGQSPIQDPHTQKTTKNGSVSQSDFEPTTQPAFVRQSSRTLSFRMMRKKEEESSPLQRSASVRVATKMFERNSDQNQDDDKQSSFARNTRQRISSRSIQETMERLAQASQQDQNDDEDKPSFFLRNTKQRISSRSIKEKMERLAQAAQKSEITKSPDVAQRTLFLMEEVSRKKGLFEKEQQEAAPSSPGFSKQDLRHVDITTKRSLFENRGDNQFSNTSSGKTYK